MKNLTDILEGILDDVEVTMARGEKDAKYALAKQTLLNNIYALSEINSNRICRDVPKNPINTDLFGNKLEIGDLVWITTPEQFYSHENCTFAIVCGWGKTPHSFDKNDKIAVYNDKSLCFKDNLKRIENGETEIDFSDPIDIADLGHVTYLNGGNMILIAKKNKVASMLKKLKNI